MVRSMRILLIAGLLAFLTGIAFGDIFKANSLQASSDGMNVTIRWVTDDETNIAQFEIERSSGKEGSFISIATLNPKGPSLYEFVDNSALQRTTTLYQYRVKVVFTNGQTPYYSQVVTVSHNLSGVRRTWGSIKSLFR